MLWRLLGGISTHFSKCALGCKKASLFRHAKQDSKETEEKQSDYAYERNKTERNG